MKTRNMKALAIFSFLLSALSLSAADKISNGYYRIQNAYTQRYLYLMDDKGSINYSAATADCSAIVPYKNLSRAIPDPASVMYIEQMSSGYCLRAQGTSTTSILKDYPLQLTAYKDGYRCWASYAGMTKYLADREDVLRYDEGAVGTMNASENVEQMKWYVIPIASDTENYFGIKPTFDVDGKHYASFYVSFPFKTVSSGMKVYMLVKQKGKKAVLSEIATDVIPAETPVLIECSSTEPADNKIEIQMGSFSLLDGNLMKGNYFRYGENYPDFFTHKNVTPYEASTDRIFGVTSEGKLGLITPTETYVPANTAYYRASSADIPSEINFVTDEAYEAKGDANSDGVVDMTDVEMVKNYAIGNVVSGIDAESADVNGDGMVNIADVIAMLKSVLGVSTAAETSNVMSVDSVKMNIGETKMVDVALDNTDQICGLQLTVDAPQGFTFSSDSCFTFCEDRFAYDSAKDNKIEYSYKLNDEGNSLTLLMYDNALVPFAGNSGSLFKLKVNAAESVAAGDYEFAVSNAYVASTEAVGYETPSFSFTVSVADASGIKSVTADGVASGSSIYNILGVKVGNDATKLTPGLYIVNGKKIIVK